MATVREELQAKLAILQAQYTTASAPILAELAKAGPWLDKDYETFKIELNALSAAVRDTSTDPTPPLVSAPIAPVVLATPVVLDSTTTPAAA